MKTEQGKRILQMVFLLACVCVLLLPALSGTEQKRTGNRQEDVQAEQEKGETAFSLSKVLGSCVRIQAEGHYGSGSIYRISEEEILIAANRHVLQYWNEDSYVTFSNGAVSSGKAAARSEQADAGFLSVHTAALTAEELEGLHAVEVSEDVLIRGDALYMVDLASDVWQPEVYEGQVLEPRRYLEEFGTEMLYGESLFRPGMSGCGVFDREGKYVGMLTGGTDQNEIAAVPADAIAKILERR